MQLNEKLAALRKNSGYSTRELGEKLGVSQSSISLWEKGDRRPDFENIVKLANIYGVSTDYLLGSDNNKSITNKLSETINYHRMEIAKLNAELSQMDKEISNLQCRLETESNFKNGLENNKLNNEDIELINLIDKRIKKSHIALENIKKKKQECMLTIRHLEKKLHTLEVKYKIEKENELQLLNSLEKIEKHDFMRITINSEYQLQVIILKYLGIYDAYRGTMLSVEEMMESVKKIINENKFL